MLQQAFEEGSGGEMEGVACPEDEEADGWMPKKRRSQKLSEVRSGERLGEERE